MLRAGEGCSVLRSEEPKERERINERHAGSQLERAEQVRQFGLGHRDERTEIQKLVSEVYQCVWIEKPREIPSPGGPYNWRSR